METDARDDLKLWKSIMTGGVSLPWLAKGQSPLLPAVSNLDQ
jgi:hypothetical protein